MVTVYILITLAISTFNAWSVGHSWNDTRVAGGLPRFLDWCGAVMSAVGFTWAYLVVVAISAGPDGFGTLPAVRVQQLISLGYLAIIVPCIGSGLAITVQSWAYFWKRRTFGSGAVAAWNMYAQLHNMYSAYEAMPSVLESVKGLFSSDSDDDDKSTVVVLLVVLAIAAGALTTTVIVRTVANRVARDVAWKAAQGDGAL